MQPSLRAMGAILLLAAVGAPGTGHAAAPVIDTVGFSLGAAAGEPFAGISLVSESAGLATFSLWGIGQASHLETNSRGEPSTIAANEWSNGYGLSVKEGYRITGITLTGEFYGALRPAQWETPGAAGNSMGAGIAIHRPGQPPRNWSVRHAQDVDGRTAFRLDVGEADLTGELALSLAGYGQVRADSVWYQDEQGEAYWLGSYADAGLGNLRMTVTVSPVPEPGTWVMLLGGLGILGAVASRRSVRARIHPAKQ